MMMNLRQASTLGLGATAFVMALMLGGGSARADLIINGSFENPSVGGGYTVFTNGGVPGWTSNNNELEIDTTSILGLANYAGTQSAELNGNTYDTISQTVTGLVIGQRYLLSWGYAGRNGAGAQRVNVLFNGAQVAQNNAVDGTPWTTTSIIVQATAASQVLSFAAVNVGGNSNAGNELDGVTLNAYVPEPRSIAIFAVALLGMVAWRKTRAA